MSVAYRFGRFEVRPATRQLLVDEQPTALGARAFDLLLALIERRGRLVGKDELLGVVWPGLVVEENNLQVQVSALRKLLGPDVIATVSGHGYRFMPEPMEVTGPALSPLPATKHNLPLHVASFIGRARELVDLRALLARHRFVTLTGVGGIGKTRLALELATTVAEGHADGVWFVDLAPVSDGRLVTHMVASTLGVREEPGRPVLETLLKFVRERAILLLVDNCEHLLSACAQLTRELLQAGQRLTIVATSREPLHVAGEATFPLPTLTTPDPRRELSLDALRGYASVQLFVERAMVVRRDFQLTEQNAVAVARICHDLDGIPLAIELAAARMRALSAQVIAVHLTDRFRLLKSGDVTALPRQQTLRATIDWSYELLSLPERVLLHRLSVFAGGFAFDAVEAVGAGGEVAPADVLELLSQLVDKSLVGFDAAGDRYRMLETVRQYAQERLAASGDEAAIRDRHLQFYVALAKPARDELNGPKQITWRALLDAERENILRAFDHARTAPGGAPSALAMVHGFQTWFSFGDIELWHGVMLEAIAHPDAQQGSVARSRALSAAAHIAYLTGRYEESFDLAQSSVRIARACDDPIVLGRAMYSLGIAAIALKRHAEAREHFLEGLALTRQTGDRKGSANLSNGLGELYSQQGQLELADAAYLESLAHGEDAEGRVINLHNLCRNAIALRAEANAVQYLREALATADPQASIQSAQAFLLNCGGIAALRGEWTFTLRLAGAAESHQKRHGLWGQFVDAPFYARQSDSARDALGAATADAALSAGRVTGADEMIREASAWLEALAAK